MLPTHKINQSCWQRSGTCSRPVCLTLRLFCLQGKLSVRSLGLVVVLVQLTMHKTSPTLHHVGEIITFYLTTHKATPELPEIRNAYHSVLVSLLLSVDMFFLCVCFIGCEACWHSFKSLLYCICAIYLWIFLILIF